MSNLVTILHSGDLHSAFDPWCRLESVARRLRAELGSDTVIRLDTGDHASRAVHLTEATGGEVNMALMAAAAVDAFVPGETETLDWSVSQQVRLAREVPFSILGANLRLSNGSLPAGVTDRAVLSRSGLRVGLFGLRPQVPQSQAYLGLVNQPLDTVATEAVRELRLDGCDVVICLSHLGYEADRELALAVRGIDVIVGGHSHLPLTNGEQVGSTVLVQAGSCGNFLGRLDLTMEGGRILSWQSSLLPTAGEEPDSTATALLRQWEAEAEERLAEVVAYLPNPVPHQHAGGSSLAELVLQRLKSAFGADAALMNASALAAGLSNGPVTMGELLRVAPGVAHPVVANMTGSELLALVEQADAPLVTLGLEQLLPEGVYRVATFDENLSAGRAPLEAHRAERVAEVVAESLVGRHFWPGQPVRVESCTIDGQVRNYVNASVVSVGPEEVVLRAGPGYRFHGVIAGKPTGDSPLAVDFHFWPGRPYNLLRFFDAEGRWRYDYYNIAMPFATYAGTLAYVDLELDVRFPADAPAYIEDEDELETAAYTPELKAQIRAIAASLLTMGLEDRLPGGPIWTRDDGADSGL
ncbi:MAG: DUF402 domain-containing protein [Mycobacterium leprae]